MYYSNICHDGCTADHLSSLQPDSLSGVSLTLQKDHEMNKVLDEQSYYRDASSGVICSCQAMFSLYSHNGQTAMRRHPSASSSCGHPECDYKSSHQAKRARVESIIKGMSSCPGAEHTEKTKNQYEESDGREERERTGSVGIIHSKIGQHQDLPQHRAESETPLYQTSERDRKEDYPTFQDSLETPPLGDCTDSFGDFETNSTNLQGWKKVKLMSFFQSKPERIKLISDVLKQELSRAVSRSVDSIFKSVPLLQTSSSSNSDVKTDLHLHGTGLKDDNQILMCCGDAEVPIPDIQTEPLSLVVQKPQLEKIPGLSTSRYLYSPDPPVPLSEESALSEDKLSEEDPPATHHHALQGLKDEVRPEKFETFNLHWNSTKVRSKVNSRSVRRQHTRPASVDPLLLESLCLPHVKMESDGLMKSRLYMLNDGLTPNHLKKAKLMFFYTRYPSSMVLRMCFHDVQFTRCITSQLIKWFSNFREFFYIQMEKFARHALAEGVTDVRSLTVERETELFRALNTHYNKANNFNVPDGFLEVAEITLREFFIAISLGKDRDPSWKKAIYKVICKLDSDVPAEFTLHHTG